MLDVLTTRGGLTATTALVACGVLVLTPMGRGLMERGGGALRPDAAREALAPDPEDPFLARAKEAGAARDAAPEAEVAEAEGGLVAAQEVLPPEPLPDPIAPVWVLPPGEVEELAPGSPTTAPEAFGAGPEGLAAPAPMAEAMDAPEAPAAGRLAQGAPSGAAEGFVAIAPAPDVVLLPEPSTEAFASADPHPLRVTAEEPVSTFSIDVDTASYAVVRQSILSGVLPPPEAVRIEEMVNYFPYGWPAPAPGEGPFRPTVSVMPTPWNPGTRLVTVAIQGERPAVEDRPPLNLVFLIDTSGSMDEPAKLPLLRQSFGLMVGELRPEDQVAVVAYAGSSGLVLPPTPASDREAILSALDGLMAGGGTDGQGGLEQAYAVAEGMAGADEVTRVVLATDGDFNLGLSDPAALEDFIAERRETGAFLSVLGFGRGNLDDATMQALAQSGNGRASYIDSLEEAQKVLVDELSGELFPIAADVKVQVEWNPAAVAEWRLVGYETRGLRREDFADDRVDAGELGAGHSVVALYEVTPVGSPARLTEPLRYGAEAVAGEASEWGFLRLRWKAPGGGESALLELPITGEETAGPDARWAAAVAGWGQLLRGEDRWLGDWGYPEAIALANGSRGDDPFGYRTEAVRLMRLSGSLAE